MRALVAGAGKGIGLLPMLQRMRLRDVRDIGGGPGQRMDQAGIGIEADARLHPEMPLLAFLGLDIWGLRPHF